MATLLLETTQAPASRVWDSRCGLLLRLTVHVSKLIDFIATHLVVVDVHLS